MKNLIELKSTELNLINGGSTEAGGWGYRVGYAFGKMAGIFTNALEEAYSFIKETL